MQFPPSEKEKALILESINKLESKLAEAVLQMEELMEALSDNFLAVDKEHTKAIDKHITKIMSNSWKVNVQLYKLKQSYKERVI